MCSGECPIASYCDYPLSALVCIFMQESCIFECMTDLEVKGWFSENPHPSVTRLCLDFGIDPVELKGLAEVDPVVCRALWGIA